MSVRYSSYLPSIVFGLGLFMGYHWFSLVYYHTYQVHTSDMHRMSDIQSVPLGFKEEYTSTLGMSSPAPPPPSSLKHQVQRKKVEGTKTKRDSVLKKVAKSKFSRGKKYHMVVTTDDGVYNGWQVQVCYYWYKKVKAQYPNSDLGGFTRLLHTGREDKLMDIIPTVVVQPELDSITGGYKVLNRPKAFEQFMEKADIPEEYIFMSEPDHLLLKPMPNWATLDQAAAFPFIYMDVKTEPKHQPLVDHFNRKNVSYDKIYATGNSPVIIHKDKLREIAPLWRNLSIEINEYPPAKKWWGWVLEMWGYNLASSQIETPLDYELHDEFMLHPPWDNQFFKNVCKDGVCEKRDAYIIHFTFGMDYDVNGTATIGTMGTGWRFDKRDFTLRFPTLDKVTLPTHPKIKAEHPTSYKTVEMIREALPSLVPIK